MEPIESEEEALWQRIINALRYLASPVYSS